MLFLIWLALAAWLINAGPIPAMLAACTIAGSALLLSIIIGVTGLERSIYYRPHELMKHADHKFGSVFKPNTRFSMEAKFGDIEAMERAGIREPHEIAYITDDLGFRNSASFHRQAFVLLGDSFVAGANDTQSCLITEWLRKDHGIDAYNLGFPGDMDDYVSRVEAFRKAKGMDFKLVLFVYEGNDFRPFAHRPAENMTPLKRYHEFFKESSLWRYTRWLFLRAAKIRLEGSDLPPVVHNIGGNAMAFLKAEMPIALNTTPLSESSMRFAEALNILKPNLIKVFFIPVKYRVYAQLISKEALPNEQWNYLSSAAKQSGIPAYDLTRTLIEEAMRQLPEGRYVYWRDDTHWNCLGMRAAAASVAAQLRLN